MEHADYDAAALGMPGIGDFLAPGARSALEAVGEVILDRPQLLLVALLAVVIAGVALFIVHFRTVVNERSTPPSVTDYLAAPTSE
jgi:hypothetical protein